MRSKPQGIENSQSSQRRNHATDAMVSSCLAIMVIGFAGLLVGCASDDSGDTGDTGSTDPCAACQPDQLCVQLNDSSTMCKSPVAAIVCRTVSAECRATITTAKSCSGTSSACADELCPSPYRCTNNAPCGNESPKAQLYCYGP